MQLGFLHAMTQYTQTARRDTVSTITFYKAHYLFVSLKIRTPLNCSKQHMNLFISLLKRTMSKPHSVILHKTFDYPISCTESTMTYTLLSRQIIHSRDTDKVFTFLSSWKLLDTDKRMQVQICCSCLSKECRLELP